MRYLVLLSVAFVAQTFASESVQYFPGRGCGTTTEIKHYYSMPSDKSLLKCAYVIQMPKRNEGYSEVKAKEAKDPVKKNPWWKGTL